MAKQESFPELPDDPNQPQQPIPPGNGNGDPPPPLLRVTSISPIGGVLAGGIDCTLRGSGFEPDAEVFFGTTPSPQVTVIAPNQLTARVPLASQVGNVVVKAVNPDGRFANAPGGFTYVTSEGSLHAEVFDVTPRSVIEDTESEITIHGRHIITAYNDGIIALRGPSRVHITSSNFSNSTDPETGIESLVLTVRITSTPPLAQSERIAIQVLASVRPAAGGDGVFESSRQMFTLLPRAVPVLLAFTSNLRAGQPNLVMVAGKNLTGCSLLFGKGATIHTQQGDDETVASMVTIPASGLLELRVVDSSGGDTARLELNVAPPDNGSSTEAKGITGEVTIEPSPINHEPLTLTPVPGQTMIGPTPEDSAVFSLGNQLLSPSFGIYFQFEFVIFEIDIIIPLFNEVRVIPFFDHGIGDPLDTVQNIPTINAQVGKLLTLRGMGLLVTLRVEIQVHIQVVLIIGFIIDIWPFGFFNEFGDMFPWAIGSIVISVVIFIDIFLLISFLVALIRPDGSLRTLFFFNLVLGIDVIISADSRQLTVDGRFIHFVRHTRIGPLSTSLLPCEGRFQLADDNGQTEFIDEFGASQSFYFPREAGQCCLPWDFQLELVRFEAGGPEETIQSTFRSDFCINAFASEGLSKILIVSTRTPNGFPPPLQLNLGDIDTLTAYSVPVDQNGNEIPGAQRRNLSEEGLVEFFLDSATNSVVNRIELIEGNAIAEETGDNLIRVDVTSVRIIDEEPPAEPLRFWPGAVLGFNILSFLARGLPPAVRTGNLPVEVIPPANTITVTPVLAYEDSQGLHEVTNSVIERLEPFETPQTSRTYVLAVKLRVPPMLLRNQTLTLTVGTVTMTPQSPLDNIPNIELIEGRKAANTVGQFFTGNLSVSGQSGNFTIDMANLPGPNDLIKITNLEIKPNNVEVKTGANITAFVPPGRAVANRDVKLTIPLTLSGGGKVLTRLLRNQLQLTVSNGETFEEYLRVFYQATNILNGTPPTGGSDTTFKDFDSTFFAALKTGGATPDVLKTNGAALFNHACQVVRTLKDDRPLYWARLRAIGALRVYAQRLPAPITGAALDALVKQFDRASRGLNTITGEISFEGAPANARKAVLTGFDPFFLPGQPDKSNSSGLVALGFNNNTLQPSPPDDQPVYIRTAVFPVRYADFDQKILESAIESILNSIVMIMTCSRGGDFYDVDRFAARRRGPKVFTLNDPQTPGTTAAGNNLLDNNRAVKTQQTVPPNLASGSSAEYLESSLPYQLVITSDASTRELPAPQTGPPFTTMIPFVRNQSYWVLGAPPANDPGKREPLPSGSSDPKSFTQVQPPNTGSTLLYGSGGYYLSNEIFYRSALMRSLLLPALATGHLHLPWSGSNSNDPINTTPGLLDAVGTAAKRFLQTLFRMRSGGDITFPNTVINNTSAPKTVSATSLTKASLSIASADITPAAHPPIFTLTTTLPAPVGPTGNVSLQYTFKPPSAGTHTGTVTAKTAGGEILFIARLTGVGIVQPPPPVITDFSPKLGILGDLVQIVGTDFDGATEVKIGSVPIIITSVTSTMVEAEVTGPTRTGKISITTPSGTAISTQDFSVRRPRLPPPE